MTTQIITGIAMMTAIATGKITGTAITIATSETVRVGRRANRVNDEFLAREYVVGDWARAGLSRPAAWA